MTRPRRQPAPEAYEVPVDSASWWPLGMSVDEYRGLHTLRSVAAYWTPERERRDREWGDRAGLRTEPLPHEPQ